MPEVANARAARRGRHGPGHLQQPVWRVRAENPVTIHDIHATILHQLGIDHERLTFRSGGRDHRLTDVHGRVIEEVLL